METRTLVNSPVFDFPHPRDINRSWHNNFQILAAGDIVCEEFEVAPPNYFIIKDLHYYILKEFELQNNHMMDYGFVGGLLGVVWFEIRRNGHPVFVLDAPAFDWIRNVNLFMGPGLIQFVIERSTATEFYFSVGATCWEKVRRR